MNFILAPSTTRDLDRLSQYFLETNVEAGERLFKKLNQKFYNLTQFPNLGKPRYPTCELCLVNIFLSMTTRSVSAPPSNEFGANSKSSLKRTN
jgi:plasmid stabilization system protein ParE